MQETRYSYTCMGHLHGSDTANVIQTIPYMNRCHHPTLVGVKAIRAYISFSTLSHLHSHSTSKQQPWVSERKSKAVGFKFVLAAIAICLQKSWMASESVPPTPTCHMLSTRAEPHAERGGVA